MKHRADADYNSTSKGATPSCGWSDKTALQCKNVNDHCCTAFDGRIYIERLVRACETA